MRLFALAGAAVCATGLGAASYQVRRLTGSQRQLAVVLAVVAGLMTAWYIFTAFGHEA